MDTSKEMLQYVIRHSTPQKDVLKWLTKQTHLRTNHARMLSGEIQGGLLSMISRMVAPDRILELGTFTGYSAICLAEGLGETGHLDTLEINDELEDLISEAFARAGISNRATLHTGDAKEILKRLEGPYDLVYIDANKREYCEYYRLVFDKVRIGGFIIADNVLWDGKVFAPDIPSDKQTAGIMAFNDLVASDTRVFAQMLPIRDGMTLICRL